MTNLIILVALLAALTGLWAASYIHRKKRTKKKMICPLRANCEMIIHSTHATTLGIPNELLGMAYFIIIGVLYAVLLAMPALMLVPVIPCVIGILTLMGVLFSIYLIVIQITVLKAWCSWCMLSAIANIVLTICACLLHFMWW